MYHFPSPPFSLSLSLSLIFCQRKVQNFGSPHDHFLLCLNFPKQSLSLSLTFPSFYWRLCLLQGLSFVGFLDFVNLLSSFLGFFDPTDSFQALFSLLLLLLLLLLIHYYPFFFWGSLTFCCFCLRDSFQWDSGFSLCSVAL
jgi:hypothetical protein